MKAIKTISRLLPISIALLLASSAYGKTDSPSGIAIKGSGSSFKSEAPATAREALHGLVVPKREVTMSAPLEGVLMRVYVEEGAIVEKGQDLAVMDERVAAASVKVARLRAEDEESVRYARLALKHAKLRLNLITKSHRAKAATEIEVYEARLIWGQAKAAFEAAIRVKAIATAALDLEIQRLEQHKVAAPFAGRIVRVFAQPGATLTTSDPLLMIVSLTELEAQIHLPLNQLGKLREGEVYRLYADEPVGRVLKASLKMIAPMIDPASQTFRCVFTIDNSDEKLPAGFSIRFLDGETGAEIEAEIDSQGRVGWAPFGGN